MKYKELDQGHQENGGDINVNEDNENDEGNCHTHCADFISFILVFIFFCQSKPVTYSWQPGRFVINIP